MASQQDSGINRLRAKLKSHKFANQYHSAAASRPQFPYQPLQNDAPSIRLFKLHDSNTDGSIQGSLRTTKDIGDYTAISYVWGAWGSQRTPPILINGVPFFVRPNLHTLLAELSRRKCKVELWIDAICINQGDVQERNQQVSMMADVYQKADRVFYWLGEGDLNTRTALRYFLDDSQEQVESPRVYYSSTDTHDFDKLLKEISKKRNELCISQGLHAIAAMDFWRRSWIVQEVLTSGDKGKLLLGPLTVSWSWFMGLYKNIQNFVVFNRPKDIPRGLSAHIGSSYLFNFLTASGCLGIDGLLSLSDVLAYFGRTQCSDIRDRIYAFRAITMTSCQVPVNYDLSPAALFCEVIRHSYETTFIGDRIHLLCRALEVTKADVCHSSNWSNMDPNLQSMILRGLEHYQKFPGG